MFKAHFTLSTTEGRGEVDGNFNQKRFFESIIGLFEGYPEDEWVVESRHAQVVGQVSSLIYLKHDFFDTVIMQTSFHAEVCNECQCHRRWTAQNRSIKAARAMQEMPSERGIKLMVSVRVRKKRIFFSLTRFAASRYRLWKYCKLFVSRPVNTMLTSGDRYIPPSSWPLGEYSCYCL
jgi:hypothetical protein